MVNEKENRSKISITADSLEEANRLFNGLSEAGDIEVANEESNMSSFFAMFRDNSVLNG